MSEEQLLRQILSELKTQTEILRNIDSGIGSVEAAVYSVAPG